MLEFLKGKKASLFGYGLTTKTLAKIWGQKMGGFDIYDNSFKTSSKDEFGNALKPVSEFEPLQSALEIPSPGFPPKHELIKKARHLQSEYDFFYNAMPKSVWISGTNGKTTTTQMTGHLLQNIHSQMGGNIGVPLAKLDMGAKLWILETSSFTLHYTKTAKPEIYALLPITADHLSWHCTFKAYVRAKLSVLKRMNEGDVAIIPANLEKECQAKAYMIFYKDELDLAEKLSIDLKKIDFQSPFLLDAVMALGIEKILLDKTSYKKLNDFKLDPHKLEELKDSKKRLWVNDTKATNLDAVMAALGRYKGKKIHLIIGGDDKGVDLSALFDFMRGFEIELYAIGTSTAKMLKYAKNAGLKAYSCEFLEKAVELIAKNLGQNEVALLSPACASLDQFKSYAHRGEVFKECVKKI